MKKFGIFLTVLLLSTQWLMAGGASDGAENASAATAWPRQSINLVVAFSAGGNSDYNARAMAKYVSRELGQPIVITNVGASGGTVAAAQVKEAKPDGYTVLVHQLSINIAAAAGVIDFTYADLAPVCVFAKASDEVIAVRSDAPWNSIQDLIADSKKNPGKFKLTANTGASTQWIAIALQNAGAQLNVVSSGGSGERIPLLLGGHVDIIPIQVNMIEDYLKTNQFKVLATVSAQRSAALPNIPTLAELGVKCSYSYLNTFFMPKGTDPAIIAKFSQAVNKVVSGNADYAGEIAAFAQEPFYMDTQPTAEHFANELNSLMEISDTLRGKK
ncbi:MAG: tripartite tricarboxylate transporter substrate binding protein [Spirochaetaceae bacterium]|jgi:tripartite-type tricarboxylate transporter receptor subunit TctC|nr:tripartite tricarboxylate transporter substrate binding protein [Spirochaetaceae bacterium]